MTIRDLIEKLEAIEEKHGYVWVEDNEGRELHIVRLIRETRTRLWPLPCTKRTEEMTVPRDLMTPETIGPYIDQLAGAGHSHIILHVHYNWMGREGELAITADGFVILKAQAQVSGVPEMFKLLDGDESWGKPDRGMLIFLANLRKDLTDYTLTPEDLAAALEVYIQGHSISLGAWR